MIKYSIKPPSRWASMVTAQWRDAEWQTLLCKKKRCINEITMYMLWRDAYCTCFLCTTCSCCKICYVVYLTHVFEIHKKCIGKIKFILCCSWLYIFGILCFWAPLALNLGFTNHLNLCPPKTNFKKKHLNWRERNVEWEISVRMYIRYIFGNCAQTRVSNKNNQRLSKQKYLGFRRYFTLIPVLILRCYESISCIRVGYRIYFDLAAVKSGDWCSLTATKKWSVTLSRMFSTNAKNVSSNWQVGKYAKLRSKSTKNSKFASKSNILKRQICSAWLAGQIVLTMNNDWVVCTNKCLLTRLYILVNHYSLIISASALFDWKYRQEEENH